MIGLTKGSDWITIIDATRHEGRPHQFIMSYDEFARIVALGLTYAYSDRKLLKKILFQQMKVEKR